MATQIVEITQPGYFLSKARGFLEVREKSNNIGHVPLDDIQAVIISVQGCTISTSLIDNLSIRNIPLVICGKNYMPSTFTLPLHGYGRQFQVIRAQSQLLEPRRKRAWQKIVKAKIRNQSSLLSRIGKTNNQLKRIIDKDKCYY